VLEVEGLPGDWVEQASARDEVWVPTAFNRDGFLRSGLARPVHIMPLGVDPVYFHPAIRAHPNPRGDFVFLANFEWGERKAPELLLSVFNHTFRRNERVVLVCKVFNRDPATQVRQRVAAIHLDSAGGRMPLVPN